MIARMKGLGKKKDADSHAAPISVPQMHTLPVPAMITYGGWHPRTAMHLGELYAFLSQASSQLPFSQQKLVDLHQSLNLQSVAREAGYMEYIRATTNDGVELRYYEDGLYILELESRNPQQAAKILKSYHDKVLAPVLHYLYSLGTPIPELSHEYHPRPATVWLSWPHHRHFEIDSAYGRVLNQVTSDDVTVYKTDQFIFVVSARQGPTFLRDLVEMQIFFREFQTQLEQFLYTHRQSWSELAIVRERQTIKPAQLPKLHRILLKQQHVTNLAQGRLAQMNAYIQSRAAITEQLGLEEYLLMLFHYRFETLEDSYHYLTKNWQMTKENVDQAAALLSTMQTRFASQLISSQRFLLILLTVSSLALWLSTSNVLTIDHSHVMALAIVLGAALGIGWLAHLISSQSEYRIKLREPKTTRATSKTGKSKK